MNIFKKIRNWIYWELQTKQRLMDLEDFWWNEWKKISDENIRLEKEIKYLTDYNTALLEANDELEQKLDHVFVFPEQFDLEWKKEPEIVDFENHKFATPEENKKMIEEVQNKLNERAKKNGYLSSEDFREFGIPVNCNMIFKV